MLTLFSKRAKRRRRMDTKKSKKEHRHFYYFLKSESIQDVSRFGKWKKKKSRRGRGGNKYISIFNNRIVKT